MTNQPNLTTVDWSDIPAPEDDGGTAHLTGLRLPSLALQSTSGETVDLSVLPGRTVVYAYPRTGTPGAIGLVPYWDQIPGARGCTPQSCAFRDHYAELRAHGVNALFGLSTQTTEYQAEARDRLHLPFHLLSDADLALTRALDLPTHSIADQTLLKRMAWVIDDGVIVKVFYPVFPPDRNATDVLIWLATTARVSAKTV
jgi:peroxiredoxin